MLTLIFVFLVFGLPHALCRGTEPKCFGRLKDLELMPSNCFFHLSLQSGPLEEDYFTKIMNDGVTARNYLLVVALLFAIKEISSNPYILPNISLIFTFYCTMDYLRSFVYSFTLGINSSDHIPNYMCDKQTSTVAGLTGPTWMSSARVGTFMMLFKWPQITFGPFHPLLSDHERFPNLYQMAPQDTYLALAMVSLMLHFSWTWVGLVISDDDPSYQFLVDLTGHMQTNRVCLAFMIIMPEEYELFKARKRIYNNWIMTSSANIVIIYGDPNSLLDQLYRRWSHSSPQRIWVSTSQWEDATTNRYYLHDPVRETLTFSHHHGDISGFKTFLQTLKLANFPVDNSLAKVDWVGFNCSEILTSCKAWKNCSLSASLQWLMRNNFDMAMSDESYNIYNAVYAVAHSLHEMLLLHVDTQPVKDGKGLKFEYQQLHSFLKNIQFINPIGDPVNMNQKENSHADYDIFNIIIFPNIHEVKVKIGRFSPHFPCDQQLYLSDDVIKWTGSRQMIQSVCSVSCVPGFRKSPREGEAVCCFDCIPCPENEISNETDMDHCVKCPDDQYANIEHTLCLHKVVTFLAYEDPMGMSLACTALFFSALTALVLGVLVKYRDTPIVKANNRTLSYILLLSLICSFLCSLLFISHPHTATCSLQQTAFAVVFTVAVSTVLAKTVTVVLAFKVTAPGRKMRGLLVSGAPNLIIPICTMTQLLFCGLWLGTSPPFIDTDTHSEHGHIIVVCNQGSITAFFCVLGYLGSLALGTFTVAFLARNLPDTFNEAKFLTFSMLVFCSVWVTFLPVYQSTKGKVMVAVQVFSILASSAGLLGCIFAPKCFVILLRPERNSLPKFRDKTHSINMTS